MPEIIENYLEKNVWQLKYISIQRDFNAKIWSSDARRMLICAEIKFNRDKNEIATW